MLYTFKGNKPQIDETVFVAPGARIIGEVSIGAGSSIWFNSVLRGDEASIQIGDNCNIQDNSTLHNYEDYPLILEDDVSIGHGVILHGCHVKKGALIGMGATVLDGAIIGEHAFIGANTLIPPGKEIPPRTMVMGSPGKVIRPLNEQDLSLIKLTIDSYREKGKEYRENMEIIE